MSILIKNILHNGIQTDVLIEGNKISKIAPDINFNANTVIDGRDKAIIPAFYNLHTHAAMSLLRSIGDDKELYSWLSEDIWPREAKFNDEIIYHGTRLAILEMIKTGTVGFSDMYFEQDAIMKAVAEMGVRARVSIVGFDMFDSEQTKAKKTAIKEFLELTIPAPERISKAISIHSVYTVSEELIKHSAQTAKENNLPLHIHACETAKEVSDCQDKYGCSPIEFLEKCGALGPNTILAHAVHLSDKDIQIILHHGVTLCTNPSSNYKLCSGIFQFKKLSENGCFITLGTDGSASNNNLSMLDEMKLCALSAKIESMAPTAGTATEIFKIATHNGAVAMGINAGEIKEGKLADCLLVDLNNPLLIPNYNIISNIVYSADSSIIDTVICDGIILMQNRHIDGEEEIIRKAKETAEKLI